MHQSIFIFLSPKVFWLNNYVHIGRFVGTFGVQGDIVIKHVLGAKSKLQKVEVLYIEEFTNSFLPYFIKSAKTNNDDEIIVHVDGINTKEAARILLKKKVWLTNEDFKKAVHSSAPVLMLGYKIINDGNVIGVVDEVIEQTHQVLLKIFLDQKEAFIPLHEGTLKKIDNKKQEVHVLLPEGLLDVYR